MFHVERMRPTDFPFAMDLANTMNWNMTVEDFVFNGSLEPGGCFILFDDSNRVGIATCISYGQVGWFGNLVVQETWRKKGAGTLLVKHAVQYLKARGAKSVGLYAYEHLVDFYEALGFKLDVHFSVFKTEATLGAQSKENIKAASESDLPYILQFDSDCFGAQRTKLLERIIREPSNPTFLSAENGSLIGYATAKVYSATSEVGPLICQRNHPRQAMDLLSAILGKVKGLQTYMCLPTAESTFADLVVENGFKKKFGVARMFLGAPVAQDCVYLAESLERG